jgi:phage tail sheath gpL-like
LGTARYLYEVQNGDTAESVASALASLLNADADASAAVDGTAISLELAGPDTLRLDLGGATAVPATITVSGTPRSGLVASVFLNQVRLDYIVREGDTIEDVSTALAALIDVNTNVVAVAEGSAVKMTLQNETASVSLSTEVDLPLSTVVSRPQGLEALSSNQHFQPGQGRASNTVSAFIGETLPAVPGDILFFNEPVAGETITVTLAETVYSYTTVEGDSLADLVTKLAAEIDGDPNVSAAADTVGFRILLTLRDPASEAKIGFTVSIDPRLSDLLAFTRSLTTTDSQALSVQFAGPVKGTAGLYQVNFTLPSTAPAEPATKLTLSQNLIIFGSVTNFDIFSNQVTFPVVAPLQVDMGGATAVPATLTLSGTPVAGERITVTLGGVNYSYTIVSGDSLETIASNLASLLDSDTNVSATASGASISLQLTNQSASVSLSVSVGF